MKTYSATILDKSGVWITNWHQYHQLAEINFLEVEKFCREHGDKAYGYYYGRNSRNLKSAKCRTVLKTL